MPGHRIRDRRHKQHLLLLPEQLQKLHKIRREPEVLHYDLLSSVFIPFLNYEYETNKEDYRSNPLPAFFI
ncbi:hypothetical protein RUMOBE_01211 [Blautia obeum ATCC 29174]|uniref:Uncharacterized protein n=1 Tax=Blautia obeum ATCC 29174 TaxID=411459 RepID=A5ZQE1_9FIRM|nr:hypothetical protein RUMOBE_01211 [Blautia obeum ATCC 29174]